MSTPWCNETAVAAGHENQRLARQWETAKAKMESAKAHLVRVGSVHRRSRPDSRDAWVIRYRERVDGRIRQRVIYLGNDESLAKQARELIQRWRREAMSPEDLRRAELLRLHKITIACLDISRRAKQRLLRQAKQTLGDRLAELAFVMSLRPDNPALWRTGRPGRPSGSGLW